MNDEASNFLDNDITGEIPRWFSVVAWVALVWNLLGVMAFAAQMMMTPEMLAALPEAERNLYENVPMWATIAFACAVLSSAYRSGQSLTR